MRMLKSRAQLLEATVMVGKQGAGPVFHATLDDALSREEMVKVKFAQFKDERKTLARDIAEKSGSHLVQQVGHVAVFYRQQPDPEKRRYRV